MKKTYQKPVIDSESILEQTSLACEVATDDPGLALSLIAECAEAKSNVMINEVLCGGGQAYRNFVEALSCPDPAVLLS